MGFFLSSYWKRQVDFCRENNGFHVVLILFYFFNARNTQRAVYVRNRSHTETHTHTPVEIRGGCSGSNKALETVLCELWESVCVSVLVWPSSPMERVRFVCQKDDITVAAVFTWKKTKGLNVRVRKNEAAVSFSPLEIWTSADTNCSDIKPVWLQQQQQKHNHCS